MLKFHINAPLLPIDHHCHLPSPLALIVPFFIHPKDGWRPLKTEIGRVTFLLALLKECLKDPNFVGFLEETLDPSISKTRHP